MIQLKQKFIRLVGLVALASSAAFAQEQVLLRKVNSTGHVSAQDARTERCDFVPGDVLIRKTYGSGNGAVTLTEARPYGLSQSLQSLMQQAASENLQQVANSVCDGPSTSITINPDSSDAVTLYSTGGCGRAGEQRTGAASRTLIDIINNYCPQTYPIVHSR
jgi:hypothetical protein